jgi:hypothetical protein
MKMSGRAFAVVVSVLLAGCSDPSEPDADGPHLLVTAGDAFVLERTEIGGYTGEIPFAFTNRFFPTVYVRTCRGLEDVIPPGLERLDGDEWVPALDQVLACTASPPFRVPQGDRLTGTVRIHAFGHGSNAFPQFDTPEVDGTYRLAWGELARVWSADGAGLVPPYGVSAPFQLSSR